MEIEKSYDTPDIVKGIILVRTEDGWKQDKIVEYIKSKNYSICQKTVSNIISRFYDNTWQSRRMNCGRKPAIDEE